MGKKRKLEAIIKELLEHMNIDLDEPGIKDTPKRVARFIKEFNQEVELSDILKTFDRRDPVFDLKDPLITQHDIPFEALCEHHLLPFVGCAAIGYIPNKTVVGLSKLTRVVRAAGRRRPTIQERITDELADVLFEELDAKGVIVVTRARHTCMEIRGVNAHGVTTTTSAVRGAFRDVPEARKEFFDLIGGK